MEITLTEEHAYYFVPQISLEVACDRIEKKKTTLVAGMFETLISRPNPTHIQEISLENRLEPYWVVTVTSRTAYDRQQIYTIPIRGEEIREVPLLGHKLVINAKGNPSLTLNGIEHCVEERRVTRDLFFNVTADAMGMIVRGGSIAVKLVKAAVDRGKR